MNCAVHTERPATAYGRTCGKALCDTCKRDVMGAIYCEPCLAARMQGAVPVAAGTPVTVVTDPPSPGLAAALGLIPGVGAMYNGQFIKALIHLAIFVCLIALSSHVSGFFGIFIPFFVLYMAFEAHETAKARRMGFPLPDHLGLNRAFGIQESPLPTVTISPTIPVGQQVVETAPPPANETPIGAIVLIALGVIFLLSNSGLIRLGTLLPLILIGLGVWLAYRHTAPRT